MFLMCFVGFLQVSRFLSKHADGHFQIACSVFVLVCSEMDWHAVHGDSVSCPESPGNGSSPPANHD